MARRPRVMRSLPALRRAVAAYRDAGEAVALVPTMGALHAGHLALVRQARKRADRVVVSIFVNPTQFAPHEDLASYPRTLAADLAALANEAVELVWAPDALTMYPEGFATRLAPEGPAQAGLEDAFRPHFFGGVATVVAKLLIQVAPDVALFGEKDYQQLKVVARLAADLDLPLKIVGVPTIRERDGLALSSRNAYLSPAERAKAPILHRVLDQCAGAMAAGEPVRDVLARGRADITAAGFSLDYLEARHADSLAPLRSPREGPVRLLVAAKLGRTRLIDNIAVPADAGRRKPRR
jgi:pantoate--beta-alanine ligase